MQSGADGTELRRVQRRLDAPEQRPFLITHVIPQQLAKRVERRDVNALPAVQIGDPAPDVYVLDENAHNVRIVGSGVPRKGRQEQFLFEPEVRATLFAPEVERRVPDHLCVDSCCAPKTQGQLECHVVLARQDGQLVRSLHRSDRTVGAGAGTGRHLLMTTGGDQRRPSLSGGS